MSVTVGRTEAAGDDLALLLTGEQVGRLLRLLRAGRAGLATDTLCALMDRRQQELLDHEGTVASAVSNYEAEDLRIDPNPPLSITPEGAWVQAWVWVSLEE